MSNTVVFGNLGRLRVTAIASTADNPLVTPRENDGKILGLPIFGISSVKPPRNKFERIDFSFQEARFEFKDFPITIPYPGIIVVQIHYIYLENKEGFISIKFTRNSCCCFLD